MKFIHFADAHIGATTHGNLDAASGLNDRVLDFLDAFDFIIDSAETEQVDFVLFAGDMFHHNRPSPQLVSEVSTRLKELCQICPIFMIPGNHDQAANRVSALNFLDVLQVDNIYVADQPTHYVFGDIFIGAVPYPRYSDYGLNDRGTDAKAQLLVAVAEKIEELRDLSAEYGTRILMFHGTVEGVQWGSYAGMAMGAEATLVADDTDDWDYVACGHIHLFQDLGNNVVYSGSIERVDFGEAVEDKGFVLVTVADGVSYKFVKIPARPMVRLLIDLTDEPITAHEQIVKKTVKRAVIHTDAMVRVIVRADSHEHINHQAINSALSHVYRVAGIVADVPRKDRRELEIDVPVGELRPDELVEEWLILKDVPDDDIDAILELFDEIMEDADAG